jgi:hypothetical protein
MMGEATKSHDQERRLERCRRQGLEETAKEERWARNCSHF